MATAPICSPSCHGCSHPYGTAEIRIVVTIRKTKVEIDADAANELEIWMNLSNLDRARGEVSES